MDENEGIQVLRSRHRNGLAIGFTGTRDGMAIDQWRMVESLIEALWNDTFQNAHHNGDCIGADAQAYGSVVTLRKKYGTAIVSLVGHPANVHERFRQGNQFDISWPIKPPLTRDKDIVNQSDVMIAGPSGYDEIMRGSGTWATIRYARKVNKPLLIVWPDGTVKVEILRRLEDG